MAYPSTVIEVMIASPSDVARERQIARDVVHQWNALNSKINNLVLLPVMWETHASPVMGDRAQEIINKEVLESCDLLVGIFWTRIGTPTGDSKSGTVEEIQKHVDAGKPAMLYFSQAPVIPDSVDAEQYKQLKEFREECQKKGLIETFTDAHDFEKKFTHQLSLRITQDKYLQSLLRASENPIGSSTVVSKTVVPAPVGVPLTAEAKEILIQASGDPDGGIALIHFIGGMFVQTNGKQFGDEHNRRSQATYESAVSELEGYGLVRDKSHKGEYFQLTREGYQVADLLKAKLK